MTYLSSGDRKCILSRSVPDLALNILKDRTPELNMECVCDSKLTPCRRTSQAGEPHTQGHWAERGRAGHVSTAAYSLVEPINALISFVGDSITHLVLINFDEEDWGSLVQTQGFVFLIPSTARLYGYQKSSLFRKSYVPESCLGSTKPASSRTRPRNLLSQQASQGTWRQVVL